MEYVLSYDICAFMIMVVFASLFFSRKSFRSIKNKTFGRLVIFVIFSIVMDLLSVGTLKYRDVLPEWINYLTNELYFLDTAMVAVTFSIYAISETGGHFYSKSRKKITKFLFYLPYDLFALAIISTPFTRLVFYFDEHEEYLHGPLMSSLLVMVVGYTLYSIIRITFFSKNLVFRRRIPYYVFALLMLLSVIVQWLMPQYLMYGLAQAIGLVVVYVSNHSASDYVDSSTNLFNRNALLEVVAENMQLGRQYYLVGVGIKDYSISVENTERDILQEYIVDRTVAYLNNTFAKSSEIYYLGNASFVILTRTNAEAMQATVSLVNRFSEPWKTDNGDIYCKIGISKIDVDEWVTDAEHVLSTISMGIGYSYEHNGKISTLDSINDEKEQRISNLENQQKELEEKVAASEVKMQNAINADKSKSMFLAQMSHEIRTPMTAILGMTELLMRDTDDEKVLEHAKAIKSSGKTLLGIINDILDFSKIEAGKMEIVEENYEVYPIICDLVNAVEQRIAEKRLHFKLYVDPDLPSRMYGDSIRVKQVITNLLTNAAKYTDKGFVSLSLEPEGGDVLKITVSDSGIGIKQENMDYLFNGFQRFDMNRNKNIEGTGLGLAICKQLVEQMGGFIQVKSVYGEGSSFIARIPQGFILDESIVDKKKVNAQKVLIYCGNDYEAEDYERTLKDFDVQYTICRAADEFDRLAAEENAYTTLFITFGEYERRVRTNDKLIRDPRLVISVYYRQYMTDLEKKRIIQMPVNSINITEILSSEKVAKADSTVNSVRKYKAPDINLLVVDDNRVNLVIFEGLLKCHGMKIDSVDSGDRCIEMAKQKKYDMIFLDHMMPKKDGIETLKELKGNADNLNTQTPTIAFTANAVSGMREMFMEQGFDDFLSKPIDITKLEGLLVEYLPEEKLVYE